MCGILPSRKYSIRDAYIDVREGDLLLFFRLIFLFFLSF